MCGEGCVPNLQYISEFKHEFSTNFVFPSGDIVLIYEILDNLGNINNSTTTYDIFPYFDL